MVQNIERNKIDVKYQLNEYVMLFIIGERSKF
jgi:hypothetical protein